MGRECKKVYLESSFQRMPSKGDELIIEGISIDLNDLSIVIDDSANSREQRSNRTYLLRIHGETTPSLYALPEPLGLRPYKLSPESLMNLSS